MALIALGVTGGIGAYKAVEIARGLQQQGHDVVAIMTRSARRFVAPLTFEAITRRAVITDQWTARRQRGHRAHRDRSGIDLLLVAPATANTLGKFAHGIADDFLSSLYLATTAPVVLAPAMNTNMFAHPAVRGEPRDADRARRAHRGARRRLSGVRLDWQGPAGRARGGGRLRPAVLAPAATAFTGRAVLVTAGPTYENIDPCGYIGNRASGRMGFAVAAEAMRRGARVTLVAGPSAAGAAGGATEMVSVRSAADMHQAVMAQGRRARRGDHGGGGGGLHASRPAPQKIAKSDGRWC